MRLLRLRSLERRLFAWLLIVSLVPALTLLGIATWLGREASSWLGASGSWTAVAESGRTLMEEAEEPARSDPELRDALLRHRQELSSSLTQANRWQFVGGRLRSLLPFIFSAVAFLIALAALLAARKIARQISRPIHELVDWTGRLAREEPLPERRPAEDKEVKELRTLRRALRNAAVELASARKRALEAERLKNWGEMARRVAHEMKNPLTPLRLAAHRLTRLASEHDALAEPVLVISEETRRLEDLAASFAMLGRPPEGPRATVNVTELLERLVASDVTPDIHTAIAASGDNALVYGDFNALLQAFRNIVRNAVEAVHNGTGERRIDIEVRARGEELSVSISDTGAGLPDNALDHVFEPDYTSKPRGTGLGLAVARQTMRAHGGDVRAQNRPGGGAEFVVTLPRQRPPVAAVS